MREDIRTFLMPEIPPPFFAEMIGISYCDGTYMIRRNNSDICVIEYVVKGTGTILVNGEKYTASAGDVYIIELGTDHLYFSDYENPWTKIFVNAKGSIIRPLLKAYGLEGRVVYPHCPLEESFREIVDLSNSTMAPDQLMERSALIFHEILIGIYSSQNKAVDISEEALKLRNMIDGNMDKVLSIEELANGIFRSPDYAIKLFKKEFGQTPHAYAVQRKMLFAKKLLVSTKKSIGEIALSIGYPDQHYFSNVFKKYTGSTPSEFRHPIE